MLSALIAAALAGAQPTGFATTNEPADDNCALVASRLRATHGYFGLIGNGAGAVVAPVNSVNPPRFTDLIGDSVGEGLGYSRIHIEFRPCVGANVHARDYQKESRGWFSRLFVGLKTSKMLQVRVALLPDDVSKDSTLTSIQRVSSKTGDEWETDIIESDVIFPYFRVGQSTVITITPSFIASSDYNSTVASDVLALAQKAAALINPALPLLTTENKDRFNKAAGFVDETVNGLLHRSVKERGIAVRIPSELGQNGELAQVMLFSPTANRTIEQTPGALNAIGIWTIRAEPLIRSLFGTSLEGDRLVASQLSSTTILAFRVADNKSLQETLLARNSVTGARDAYLQATKAADKAKAGAQFCGTVAVEAGKIGFAPADVGAAAWAMAVELEPEATAQDKLLKACRLTDHFPIVR